MKTIQEIVDEFDEFAQINDLYLMKFPFSKHKAWLTKQLTEERRNTEIELRTKYVVVSKEVLAQHEQQVIEEAKKEERKEVIEWVEKNWIMNGDAVDRMELLTHLKEKDHD